MGGQGGCGRGCFTTVGQQPLRVADVSAAPALPTSRELHRSSEHASSLPCPAVPQITFTGSVIANRGHIYTIFKDKLVYATKNNNVKTFFENKDAAHHFGKIIRQS